MLWGSSQCVDRFASTSVPIAQIKPTSSRASAVTILPAGLLLLERLQYRRCRRSWARQAMAATFGGSAFFGAYADAGTGEVGDGSARRIPRERGEGESCHSW